MDHKVDNKMDSAKMDISQMDHKVDHKVDISTVDHKMDSPKVDFSPVDHKMDFASMDNKVVPT